jgi:hypothetical protein
MSEHRASFEKVNADAEPVVIGRRLPSEGQDPSPGRKDTKSEISPQGIRRSSGDGMCAEEIRGNTGDPQRWCKPTEAPRGAEQVGAGVGKAHSSEEASNDRGAKGPQFRVKANVIRARQIDENLTCRIKLGSRRRFVCRSEGEKAPAFSPWTKTRTRYSVRKPRCGKSARPV